MQYNMNIILYPIVESIFTYDQHGGKRKSCMLYLNHDNNSEDDVMEISRYQQQHLFLKKSNCINSIR